MKLLFAFVLWAALILKIVINEKTVTGGKWNKRLRDFKAIAALPSYEVEEERHIRTGRPEEYYDFNGEPLELTYYENPRFFEFYDDDTKATGIVGDIWTALSEHLNFTLVLNKMRTSDSTIIGYNHDYSKKLLKHASLNQTDIIPITMVTTRKSQDAITFTPIFWTNRLRIFARPRWKGDINWMFDVFSWIIWALLFTTALSLGVASIVVQKVLISNGVVKRRGRSYIFHIFYTFASLCNQSNSVDNARSGSRMLTVTVAIFSWLSLTTYGASLMNNLTMEIIDSPFHDLSTLLENTNLQILVLADSFSHFTFFNSNSSDIFHRIVRANRVSIEPDVNDAYEKVCWQSDKYVLFDEEDGVATRETTICELIPVDVAHNPHNDDITVDIESQVTVHIASAMSGRVSNKNTIAIGVMKLLECGVMDRIKNRYMSSKPKQPHIKRVTSVLVDFYRVILIFTILGIGVLASIIICVIEIVVDSNI